MKSTYNRASSFFSILFNATLVLLFAIFVISYFTPPSKVQANISISKVEGRGVYKVMFFHPNIDLKPQFTFNTKQIFIYLTCRKGDSEQMVWSKIIKNGQEYKLFKREISNYTFSCNYDTEYEFELAGNIFPYTGQMLEVKYGSVKYKIPSN